MPHYNESLPLRRMILCVNILANHLDFENGIQMEKQIELQTADKKASRFFSFFKKSTLLIYLVIISAVLQLTPSLIYHARSPSSPVTKGQIQQDLTNAIARQQQRSDEDIYFIQAIAKNLNLPIKAIWVDEKQPQLIHCRLKNSKGRKKLALYLQAASQRRSTINPRLTPLLLDQDKARFLELNHEASLSASPNEILTISRPFIPATIHTNQFQLLHIDANTKESIVKGILNTTQQALKTAPAALGISTQFQTFLQDTSTKSDEQVALSKEILFWQQWFKNHPQSQAFFAKLLHDSIDLSDNQIDKLVSQLEQFSSEIQKEVNSLSDHDEDSKERKTFLQIDSQRHQEAANGLRFILATPAKELALENHPLFTQLSSEDTQITLTAKEASSDHSDFYSRAVSIALSQIQEETGFTFNATLQNPSKFTSTAPIEQMATGYGAFIAISDVQSHEQESVHDLYSRLPIQSQELQANNFPLLTNDDTTTAALPYFGIHTKIVGNKSAVILEGIQTILDTLQGRDDRDGYDRVLEDLTALDLLLASRGYRISPLSLKESVQIWGRQQSTQRSKAAIVYLSDAPLKDFAALTRLQWKKSALATSAGTQNGLLFLASTRGERAKILNKIDDIIHEEHLQERDNYERAQVDLNKELALLHPLPRHNLLLDNLKLTLRKVLRGDQSKTLKWGLDLYGGKTVRISLEDANGQSATDPAQLQQAQSELGARVNKLGISEVAIRIEGEYLVLDFPSSQNMRASELIEAAQMRFHVVNETFSSANLALASDVQMFFQEITAHLAQSSKQHSTHTAENLTNAAAYLLGFNSEGALPKTPSAKKLRDSGLKVSPFSLYQPQSEIDTTASLIIPQRAEKSFYSNQTPAPLIVFANHALAGKDLASVKASYDPEHGNTLSFSVSSEATTESQKNPQDIFGDWTKSFSTGGIRKTAKESTTQGRGWRMAVVLNGEVVSAPTLSSELREHAMIHGSFSQREVEHLASDLKAGALSFTPKILTEENISPELGAKDRTSGLYAALVGFFLVVALMSGYYGFAGRIASCAVFFNLLLTWAILQYLGAALTLSGIAALVLTVGMSVDANVLIFERMREELAKKISLKGAITAGYARAYSAIIDSNLTTILAALILIQFDSGPIKGFAITLIVGIASSMFTALYMTKAFFTAWSQRPGNVLVLHRWLPEKIEFNFFRFQRLFSLIWVILTLSGLALVYEQRSTILGMDFTGGYSLEVTFSDNAEQAITADRRSAVRSALQASGIDSSFIEMREFEGSSRMKLQLHGAVDQTVFQDLDQSTTSHSKRIAFVKDALTSGGVEITESLYDLETKYSSVSGQFSSLMRNNAIIAIFVALIAILIYLAVRFEWRFAISAVAGLSCDILATLSAIGWLRLVGVPLKIDLQAIGAIMTIIGYALNDTIIIFDRIRESGGCQLGDKPAQTINRALCETLSRTLMTSGTTLVALLSLNMLGGQGLVSFSMIMTTGIIVGTICSLFITSFILRYVWITLGKYSQNNS